jgi:hypothetical protein
LLVDPCAGNSRNKEMGDSVQLVDLQNSRKISTIAANGRAVGKHGHTECLALASTIRRAGGMRPARRPTSPAYEGPTEASSRRTERVIEKLARRGGG